MGSRKRTVICGGGPNRRRDRLFHKPTGAQLIVIERHEAAGAASGKSGGFLALDWCGGIRTQALMAGRTRIDLRLRVLWGWGWVCAVFFRLRLGTATRCLIQTLIASQDRLYLGADERVYAFAFQTARHAGPRFRSHAVPIAS